MARKQRDYRAEEARRNELARQRGFTSRAAQRRAIERGKAPAIQPHRIRSERTRKAQAALQSAIKPLNVRKYDYAGIHISGEQRATDWSTIFAGSDIAQYHPERARSLGVTKKQYTDAYLRAFVLGDERYAQSRYYGGSDPLYYWFVTLNGYYSADEYESRYGRVR